MKLTRTNITERHEDKTKKPFAAAATVLVAGLVLLPGCKGNDKNEVPPNLAPCSMDDSYLLNDVETRSLTSEKRQVFFLAGEWTAQPGDNILVCRSASGCYGVFLLAINDDSVEVAARRSTGPAFNPSIYKFGEFATFVVDDVTLKVTFKKGDVPGVVEVNVVRESVSK